MHRLFRFPLRLVEQVLRPRLGLAQDRLILQQERRLLLCGADDLLRLFAGLREHAIALLVDAPGLFDLFGDGDAELVDEVEDRGLLEDDLAGHRDFSSVDNEGLEALDQELYVHVTLPQRGQCTAGIGASPPRSP